MNKTKVAALSLAGVMGVGLGGRVALAGEGSSGEERELEINPENKALSMTDLPKPAQAALRRETKGSQVEELRKETLKDATVVYEAMIVKDGKTRRVSVTPGGRVIDTTNGRSTTNEKK
jgi:hypothetical protein